jgi:4-alpha-glucanotransferase
VVAGVPPDYFSATGQRWGNPLYRWDRLAVSDYRFWIDRIRTQMALFDIIRIDHFRGFEAFWEIPGDEPTAINGTWVQADGDALFARLQQEFGRLPLVAEDLGVITEQVTALRRKYRMPGMKVLQFAFGGGADNPYLPVPTRPRCGGLHRHPRQRHHARLVPVAGSRMNAPMSTTIWARCKSPCPGR